MGKIIDHKDLDKYYTNPSVAKKCYRLLSRLVKKFGLVDVLWIEPSAGSGVFLDFISSKNYLAFDIEPEDPRISKKDFLSNIIFPSKDLIFIGNPPFGEKGNKAISFLNKSLNNGVLVGFILPIQFRKHYLQNNIHPDAVLLMDETINEDAFTFKGQVYSLRTCFQVWTLQSTLFPRIDITGMPNLRSVDKPILRHQDFELYQYNRTEEAKKYFSIDWDFAVLRQGYGDYTKLYNRDETLDQKKQWMFIKSDNSFSLNILRNIDYVSLSKKNTSIPGFGKADVISEYIKQEELMTPTPIYEAESSCPIRLAIAKCFITLLSNPDKYAGSATEGEEKLLGVFNSLKILSVIITFQPNGNKRSPDIRLIWTCNCSLCNGYVELDIQAKGTRGGNPMWNESYPSSDPNKMEVSFFSGTTPKKITCFWSSDHITKEEEDYLIDIKDRRTKEMTNLIKSEELIGTRVHLNYLRPQWKFDGIAGHPFKNQIPNELIDREKKVISKICIGTVTAVPIQFTKDKYPLLVDVKYETN